MANIELKYFRDINLNDNFFYSLKSDYAEFEKWYKNKALEDRTAFVLYENSNLMAFLYLKIEDETDDNIFPIFSKKRRLKVGTFKIDAHGTKLGERFIKKIFDIAIDKKVDEIYVTIFEKHLGLLNLLKTFGFYVHGIKTTTNGEELVLIKRFEHLKNDILKDYPIIQTEYKRIYGLSIYPVFHTRLFSDSILNNESVNILEDCSYTNSIHKIYLSAINDVQNFKKGDVILIYRTTDNLGPARFRSVITSICVVEEILNINNFKTVEEFLRYCDPYSIFTEDELRGFYRTKRYPFIIKMTYNIAFKKRVTNGQLIDEFGMPSNQYWGVFNVTHAQFKNIIKVGEVNESLIIN